jgi:hypothetical protein
MFAEDRFVDTGFSFSNEVPSPPERREGERHLKILRVGTLTLNGRRELCLVRNISAGGMMAHIYSTIETGEQVSVELKTNQPISGRVVWARAGNAGIQFDSLVEVSELLANPSVLNNGWRPRSPRVQIDRVARLRAGSRTHSARARDISQSGVRIDTDQAPDEGAEIVLTLEEFRPLAGVVRWRSSDACGIAFNGLIPFGELIDWLKKE